jgi:hypothetical protein
VQYRQEWLPVLMLARAGHDRFAQEPLRRNDFSLNSLAASDEMIVQQ